MQNLSNLGKTKDEKVLVKGVRKMIGWVLVGATVITYGSNFLAYRYLKNRPSDWFEKIALYFGVNMSVLFADGIFLFIAKLVEEGILLIE